MTRWTDAAIELAAKGEHVTLSVLVDLAFSTGTERMHDGAGELIFGGNTYLGVGRFGSIEPINETTSPIPVPMILTMSGIDTSLLSVTRDEYIGRAATIYVGLLDSARQFIGGGPQIVWEGRMSHLVKDLGVEGTMQMHCRHRLDRRPNMRRFTHEDQIQDFAGDLGFNFVPELANRKVQWQQRSVVFGIGGGGSGPLGDDREVLP